jgi:hypothetical protein
MSKRIKLILPTEVPIERHSYVDASGNLITLEEYRKLVVPSKKNQKRAVTNPNTLRAYIIPSQQYIDWKKINAPLFEQMYLKLEAKGVSLPIVRCDIRLLFYYPDSHTRDNHNKFETIADMMVDAGILADDSFKVFNDTSMKGKVCRHQPRTEIYITLLAGDHPDYEWDITDQKKYKARLRKRDTNRKRHSRAKTKAAAGEPADKLSDNPEAIRKRDYRRRKAEEKKAQSQ